MPKNEMSISPNTFPLAVYHRLRTTIYTHKEKKYILHENKYQTCEFQWRQMYSITDTLLSYLYFECAQKDIFISNKK